MLSSFSLRKFRSSISVCPLLRQPKFPMRGPFFSPSLLLEPALYLLLGVMFTLGVLTNT